MLRDLAVPAAELRAASQALTPDFFWRRSGISSGRGGEPRPSMTRLESAALVGALARAGLLAEDAQLAADPGSGSAKDVWRTALRVRGGTRLWWLWRWWWSGGLRQGGGGGAHGWYFFRYLDHSLSVLPQRKRDLQRGVLFLQLLSDIIYFLPGIGGVTARLPRR